LAAEAAVLLKRVKVAEILQELGVLEEMDLHQLSAALT
tara:strand:- start:113 stop:226 length:114 start_codon:yes stop_codon:yes gene_type:complete